MKAWLATLATLPLFTGCMVGVDSGSGSRSGSGSYTKYGDGFIVSETRSLPSFWSVETHGNINVLIQEGSRFEAVVTTDDNLSDYLCTSIQGNRLIIDWSRTVQATATPTVRVTLPSLEEVRHYGRGDVEADLSTWHRDLVLESSGSGSLTFIGAAAHLSAVALGSGRLELVGYADMLDATVESSGDLLADGLIAADASAEIDGSGDLTLDLDDGATLHAAIYGSGNLEWWGWPSKTVYTLVGSGKVIEHRGLAKAAASSKMATALKYKALKPKA